MRSALVSVTPNSWCQNMSETPRLKIVLVDGSNLFWRAAMGFPARIIGRRSEDITPTFGFFALLRAGLRSIDAQKVVLVFFDSERSSNQNRKIDYTYKNNRFGDLSHFDQFDHLIDGLNMCGIRNYVCDDYEADDAIASAREGHRSHSVTIFSSDKDFYQLVDEKTEILDTQKKKDAWIINANWIVARYGVLPSQWVDYRSLIGDPADNIKGITGIGPKKAQLLLGKHVTLDNIASMDSDPGPLEGKVLDAWDDLERARALLRLDPTLKLEQSPQLEPTADLPIAAKICEGLSLLREKK
ncbi:MULTISPECIES: 5'-3' exonuclease [Hyphobacterium]|uniref:5'-3' exonuclease H3TH domain-containing protein n=1 Tax=Hyphobacterium vulgare TaxID=1736751 RepID=A0ABV6ZWU4_9PROT